MKCAICGKEYTPRGRTAEVSLNTFIKALKVHPNIQPVNLCDEHFDYLINYEKN